MLHTNEIDTLLRSAPPDLRDVVFELRNLVAVEAPGVTEAVRWGALLYFDARRGGPVKGGVCLIEILPDHVRLGFIHGAWLADPRGLLQGGPRYKRFVRIDSFESAPWEDLRGLIHASARFDPRTPAPP